MTELRPETVLDPLAPSADGAETTTATTSSSNEGQRPDDPRPLGLDAKLHLSRLRSRLLGVTHSLPRIGRFAILRKLGEGGMGEVFVAYDEELHRKLAIKLLLPRDRDDELDRSRGHERVRREAQALARLSHPNVVHAYEVGIHENGLFIAMEFIEGQTLRRWLERDGDRTWREVLLMFLQAGRGLAAAHAAGLVHRDFKPDNVIVGKEGRPRVVDFGLARAGAERSVAEATPLASASRESRLTQTGALIGTPAYMAPEQYAGQAADERSDQFSFCVALWEGMHGIRPSVEGAVPPARRRSPTQGPPRQRAAVPGWVRKALERGLSPDPADRWPSMDALLARLAADPGRRRRRLVTAVLLVAAIVAYGVSEWGERQHQRARCADQAATLTEFWNPLQQQTMRAAFLESGARGANVMANRASEQLDRYASSWKAMAMESCEATHVRDVQSSAMYSLRWQCLERLAAATRQLVALLQAPDDRNVVYSSVGAISQLEPVAVCGDVDALRSERTLIVGLDAGDQVAGLRHRVSEVEAHIHLGHYKHASQLLGPLIENLRQAGYQPLLARALLLRGSMLNNLGRWEESIATMEQAYYVALSARKDRMAADAARLLIWYNNQLERRAEAHRWERDGKAMVARLGEISRENFFLLNSLAMGSHAAGDPEQAVQLYRRALDIGQQLEGPENHERWVPLGNLGAVYNELGEFEKARACHREALAIVVSSVGRQHPNAAPHLHNLGEVQIALGQFEEARRNLQSARDTWEEMQGSESPSIGYSLAALGRLAIEERRHEQAVPLLEQAMALREENGEPLHLIAEVRFLMARALWTEDATIAALARARRLAHEARQNYRQLGDMRIRERTEVETWLERISGSPAPYETSITGLADDD